MADWFKFYENDLDETRFQYAVHQLSEVCPVWVGILSECCRHKSDTIRWGNNEIELFGFSQRLNVSVPKVNEAIKLLVDIDYISRGENTLKVLKWNTKQSDYCSRIKRGSPNSVRTVSEQCPLRGEERRVEENKHTPAELGLVCDEVPKSLNTFEFLEVWGKWKEYRMAIKRTGKRAIALTFNAQLKKLSSLPVQEAIAQINQSIEKGWTGLFEVQKSNGHSNCKSNGASLILYNDEYKRILDTMRVIRSQYQDHQTWTQADLDKYGKLKARKAELKTLLGIVA